MSTNEPTPERLAKGDMEPWKPGEVRRVNSNQIEYLFSRGKITQHQYEAANRLFKDWWRSGLHTERAPIIQERVQSSPDPERIVENLNHRSAYAGAIRMLGTEPGLVATAVCVHDKALSEVGAYFGYSGRRDRQVAAFTVLKLALDILAHHYGYRAPRPRMRVQKPDADELDRLKSLVVDMVEAS